MKIDHQPEVEVKLDKLELLEFIRTGFGPMNSLCDRAGLFEDRIHARTKAIFESFRLPFEAPHFREARPLEVIRVLRFLSASANDGVEPMR